MPRVIYAHRYDTDRYKIHKKPNPVLIEITYILAGNSHIRKGKEEMTVPANSVIVSLYDEESDFTSPDYHRHTTVGFLIDYKRTSSGGIILPWIYRFETSDNPLLPILEQLVLLFNMNPGDPRVTAMLFELIGKLSCLYQSDLRGEQAFGKEWYVSRAQKYIIDNIAKPLRVTDVAESLDISTGYLSHLFSEVTGQTVTQYINTVRIKQVEELLISYGMDLKQAGEQVGLSDPSYVSRLFKRIRGCSISDLRHARRKIGDE